MGDEKERVARCHSLFTAIIVPTACRRYSISTPGIIFDGDDSLWLCQELYEEAKALFFLQIEPLGFGQAEASTFLERLDATSVSAFGFSRDRFPRSLVRTYNELCTRAGTVPDPAVETRILEIGSSVFRRSPRTMPGAEAVLAALRPFYRLVLYTQGEVDLQLAKLESSGLRSFFSEVYVHPTKTVAGWLQIAEEQALDLAHSWAVGNSLRFDIEPALAIGLKAIWIRTLTWVFEGTDLPPQTSPRLWQVHSLLQLLPLIPRGPADVPAL